MVLLTKLHCVPFNKLRVGQMCSVAHEIRGFQTDDSFLLKEPVFAVVQDPTDPSGNRKAGLLLGFEGQYEKYTFGNQGVIHLVDLGTKKVVDIGVVSASEMLKICHVFDSATARIYDFPWNKERRWGRVWRKKKGHNTIYDVSKNCIREHTEQRYSRGADSPVTADLTQLYQDESDL